MRVYSWVHIPSCLAQPGIRSNPLARSQVGTSCHPPCSLPFLPRGNSARGCSPRSQCPPVHTESCSFPSSSNSPLQKFSSLPEKYSQKFSQLLKALSFVLICLFLFLCPSFFLQLTQKLCLYSRLHLISHPPPTAGEFLPLVWDAKLLSHWASLLHLVLQGGVSTAETGDWPSGGALPFIFIPMPPRAFTENPDASARLDSTLPSSPAVGCGSVSSCP